MLEHDCLHQVDKIKYINESIVGKCRHVGFDYYQQDNGCLSLTILLVSLRPIHVKRLFYVFDSKPCSRTEFTSLNNAATLCALG
jgi:hypothetical protein